MRWWKALAGTLLVLLVLVAGLVILLLTSPVREFLLRRVESVGGRVGVPFKAEGLDLEPLDLSFSLSKFEYDKNGLSIRIRNLKVALPWNAWGPDGINVTSLTADELHARFVAREPAASAGGPSDEPMKFPLVRIGRLDVKDGSFVYESSSTRIEIPSLSMNVVDGAGKIVPKAPVAIDGNTRVRIEEIPIRLSPEGLKFGPVTWTVSGDQSGSGTVSGEFRWAPVVRGSANFATDPFAIKPWDGIVLRGQVEYEKGVLTAPEFVATRGDGVVSGALKISDSGNSVTARWSNVRIDPTGVDGVTNGQLTLEWQAPDLSDARGNGRVSLLADKYGTADSDVTIADGRARLMIDATAMGAVIHADAVTGLDRRLAGTFSLTHRENGMLSAEGTLAGDLLSPVATANITASDVTLQGIGPIEATAQASYRDMAVQVTMADARYRNSKLLNGHLRIDLQSEAIEGGAPSITAQLQDFIPDAMGEIGAMAEVSGTIEHPIASFKASSMGLEIGGTHIDKVAVDAQLKDNLLQVIELEATQDRGVLRVSGEANLATEQITGKATVSNLRITQVRGLSGTVDLKADIAGTYRKPLADFQGSVADVTYQGQEHGAAEFSGTVDGEKLRATARSPKYHASVDGTVALIAPYAFTADLKVDQGVFEYQQYHGSATGRVVAGGTLEPVSVDRLEVQALKVTAEGIDLTASGALDTGIQADAVADLARLPLNDINLTGQAEISAIVRGPVTSPVVDGQLRTTGATVQVTGMPEAARVEAAVDFTRNRFEIRQMRATYADAEIVVEGNGSLQGSGEFTFTAENIRPERLLPGRPLSGVVGLEGQISVSAPRLDSIEGRATVTQLDIIAGGVQFHQTEQGEVALARGELTVRKFALSGPETTASVNGSVNTRTGSLSLDLRADTDLRILEGFIPRSNASGHIDSQVAIRGDYRQPDMNGFVRLNDAQLQLFEPPLLVSDLNADVRLSGSRFQIQRASGDLNGGALDLTGGGEISRVGLSNVAIQASLMGTQLEYPEGLQSEIAARLSLSGSMPNLTLAGNVEVLDALYRQNVDLRGEVLRRLTLQQRSRAAAAQKSAFGRDINLNVMVMTTGPVAVAINVASLDLTGAFQVRGTLADPVVLGRATVLEGGEVFFGPVSGEATALGERRDRYIVERGTLDFVNPLQTEPTIDFEATHELKVKNERYLIRLRVSGTPTDLRTELTSDPYLSEPDIIAMLLTGRSFADLQSAHLSVARDQVLNYLSGQLTTRFIQGAGSALGLDTVTIEPVTIASETDVSARLTVGKDLTQGLNLVYSQNLSGARDQAWIVNYSLFKDFVLRGVNRTDQDQIRFELHHGLEFGGGPSLPRRIAPREEPKLQSVAFNGSSFSSEDLEDEVTKIGKPYNIYRMNDDVRSLREFFSSSGYPEARVRAKRTVTGDSVDVVFNVTQGPMVRFDYRGAKVPHKVQKQVLSVWETGFAETSSLRESLRVLLRYFRDEGYLQADVSARDEALRPDQRLFVFQIDLGLKFEEPRWLFQGIEIPDLTTSAGEIMDDPEAIREEIEFDLKGRGFLEATATVPQLVIRNGLRPRFVVTIDKGPLYSVSALNYSGNAFFSDAWLSYVVLFGPTKPTTMDAAGAAGPPGPVPPLVAFPYSEEWLGIARRRILTEYWQQGFNEVQIVSSTDYKPGSGKIAVTFEIREGERQKIADIQIHGDTRTMLSHLRRYFQFKQNDPVDYTRINLTRKKLYDTGLFKRVDIEVSREPVGYVAVVNLNERAPWALHYGFTIAENRNVANFDLGVSGDITHRNVFGKGITAGLSLNIDPSFADARLFTSFPVFLDRDVATTGSIFRTRETFADSVSNTWGITIQQFWRPSDFYVVSYDYSLRRISTFKTDVTEVSPDIVTGVVRLARFNATVSRDTRNDILNATRGSFLSNSLQFAPPGIGSTIRYVRNYWQYLQFKQIWLPNLIWASAYRLGLAGSTEPLPETDQFNAADSLRAFGRDSLSFNPGNALTVTNQELRHPLFWRFGVAGFLDVGNNYDSVRVLHLLDQRYSPGFGLRVDTPFLLLRVDLAFNPFPEPGESARRVTFGIGQAF
ncbi:MAG TPA: translocation/assembly module TamB domain-containing protein [Terriglobia bacterium]|nr:translocation/assembly module TamB domain-containing protein [Terriglobia bacterium]